jgi:hypothetical protein
MNLNTATNEQLDEYRLKTASILKIDPFMLDYIWMSDPETGLKNRVLYAKRGAAEILRQNLSISVESLVPSVTQDGLLSFMASGRDKTGRQEIAVGSAYLDGLKGDKKAHAVMTAQTRAVRRLTLQFVGGGILDETEVQAQSALQGAPAASEATLAGSPAVLPPPTVAPSIAPGKDITPLVNQGENIAKVYAEGAATLAAMPVPKAVIPEYSVAQNPQNVGDMYETIEDTPADIAAQEVANSTTGELPKKRQYRRKNQVNIASPGQQAEIPAGQIDATGKITPIVVPEQDDRPLIDNNNLVTPIQPVTQGTAGVPAIQVFPVPTQVNPVAQVLAVPVLSKEKQDEYRARLSKYYNDILPRGGMQSSENIGGPTMKTRKFAAIHTGVADTKQMTEQHWEDLFEFLDSHASDPKFLVNYINKALGVA